MPLPSSLPLFCTSSLLLPLAFLHLSLTVSTFSQSPSLIILHFSPSLRFISLITSSHSLRWEGLSGQDTEQRSRVPEGRVPSPGLHNFLRSNSWGHSLEIHTAHIALNCLKWSYYLLLYFLISCFSFFLRCNAWRNWQNILVFHSCLLCNYALKLPPFLSISTNSDFLSFLDCSSLQSKLQKQTSFQRNKRMYLFYGTMYYYLVCEFQTSCFSVAREAFRTAESTPASRTRVLPCVAAHRAESSCGACGGQSSHADVGGRVLIVPPRLSRTTAVCATVEAGVGAVWGTLALDSVL